MAAWVEVLNGILAAVREYIAGAEQREIALAKEEQRLRELTEAASENISESPSSATTQRDANEIISLKGLVQLYEERIQLYEERVQQYQETIGNTEIQLERINKTLEEHKSETIAEFRTIEERDGLSSRQSFWLTVISSAVSLILGWLLSLVGNPASVLRIFTR